jgi:hypothetical protein
MSQHRWFRSAFVMMASSTLIALFSSSVRASDTNKANCIRGSQGCKIGVENLNCGRGDWHCKSTWKNDCLCFAFGIVKDRNGCAIVTQWRTIAQGPLQPNTVTVFQAVSDTGNSVNVFEFTDPAPDSGSAEIHTAKFDLVGQLQVALMSGPPDSIPAQIQSLNMNVVSFMFQGVPTGPNQIVLDSLSALLGVYDQFQQILDFNQPIPCTLINDRFPAGQRIYIRPRAIRADSGRSEASGGPPTFLLNLSATLYLGGQTDVSDPPLAVSGILTRPNPFSDGTTVVVTVPVSAVVRLDVFDMSGRWVRALARDRLGPGSHQFVWDGRDAAGRRVENGIYFIRGTRGGQPLTARSIVMR